MRTYTGRLVSPLYLKPEDISIEDIAHSLSNICRYGGHAREFYSVAQHSLLVSSLLPSEFRLEGLLHDAFEAYGGDIPRPIKYTETMDGYRQAEDWGHRVIAKYFGIPETVSPEVKAADNAVLVAESYQLMNTIYTDFGPPAAVVIKPMKPEDAKDTFLRQYGRLIRERAWGMSYYGHS